MILKENIKKNQKMFIVADLASLSQDGPLCILRGSRVIINKNIIYLSLKISW